MAAAPRRPRLQRRPPRNNASFRYGGFAWSVTFIHEDQAGDQPLLTPVYEGTLLGTSGTPWVATSEVTAGNSITGSFNVSLDGAACAACTTEIAADATAADVADALVKLPQVPPGTVAVSRSGPDYEGGYVWTVSFLDDANRTWEGDVSPFTVDAQAKLLGRDAKAEVAELRKGTLKEIQTLNVTRGGENDTKNDYFYLNFRGATTGKIWAASDPLDGTRGDAIWEVQKITSRTCCVLVVAILQELFLERSTLAGGASTTEGLHSVAPERSGSRLRAR